MYRLVLKWRACFFDVDDVTKRLQIISFACPHERVECEGNARNHTTTRKEDAQGQKSDEDEDEGEMFYE